MILAGNEGVLPYFEVYEPHNIADDAKVKLMVKVLLLLLDTVYLPVQMYLYHADKLEEGQEFIVTGDKSQLQPKVQLQEQWGRVGKKPFF